MGCGASQPQAAPLDPPGARNKSSSVVSVNQTKPTDLARTDSEDNPFLDKQPGIDEHKIASARKKVERSEEKEEDETDDPLKSATPKSKKRELAGGEEEKEGAAGGDDSEEEKTSDDAHKGGGRQLLPASTPVTPAGRSSVASGPPAGQPRKDGPAVNTAALARSNSFTDLLAAQQPSYNLADPLTLTTGMSKAFLHYAHKKFDTSPTHAADAASHGGDDDDDEDKLDKKAMQQLTLDCVLTFMTALRKETAKIKESNRKKEEEYLRRKNLPGDSVEEVLDVCKEYLKSEMVWKNGAVTKTCFFFHFPRAFRALFVYEKMTLEREQLVVKWNKVAAENRAKAEKEREKERKKDEANMAGLDAAGGEAGDKEKKHKDKKKSKDKKDRKKSRQTAPANSDLFANMATHGAAKPPQLAQAEAKLKSAHVANSGKSGSSKDVLKEGEKDDED